ncbi:hypothetical protein ACLOJK_038702, partial [Asimina triloba]
MASDPPLSPTQMQRTASRFKSKDAIWANPNHSKAWSNQDAANRQQLGEIANPASEEHPI